MEEGKDEGNFVVDAEDVAGRLTAVMYYECPECGTRARFTAEDERADGTLACPGLDCGSIIRLEGDGLKGGQRKLDDVERMLPQ